MTVRLEPLPLAGAYLAHRSIHRDLRGTFSELWREDEFRAAGLDVHFVQINSARSKRNVLRGLHYQRNNPQGKLVTVLRGAIQDVILDMRPESRTYARTHAIELSEDNGCALWVPPGFAHGYCVLSDETDMLYKCTALYDPADEHGVRWNDPSLAIQWKVDAPILSARDAAWADLGEGE
jgi:dTDP-4-dehydrorhamnose 3,5-epimerase